jgi:hypothetical protein
MREPIRRKIFDRIGGRSVEQDIRHQHIVPCSVQPQDDVKAVEAQIRDEQKKMRRQSQGKEQ